MKEYIEREAFIESQQHLYCENCARRKDGKGKLVYDIGDAPCRACGIMDVLDAVADFPAADVRLIDADALMESDGDAWDGMWGYSGVEIMNAPTIISADTQKDDEEQAKEESEQIYKAYDSKAVKTGIKAFPEPPKEET